MIDLQKKISIDWTVLSCCGACSITFLAWTYSAIGSASYATFAFFILLPVAFYCVGTAGSRWLGLRTRLVHPAPFALLLGSVVCTLAIYFLHLLLPLSLRWTEAILFPIAVIIYRLTPPAISIHQHRHAGPIAFASIALSLLAGSFWTQDIRPALDHKADATHVRPWLDVSVHAQIVSQLHLNRTMLQLGDPDMVGRPAPVYHYASYMLPASVEAWNDDATALDSIVAFWIPFGMALVSLSAYCLAAEWGGELAGLAALAAVVLLPDPSRYAIPIQFYCFYWILLISPGLTYGIAGAAAGCVLLSAGIRRNSNRLILGALALELATVFLKAHIAIVTIPLAFVWFIATRRDRPLAHRIAALAFLGLVGLVSAILFENLKIGFTLLPAKDHARLVEYVKWSILQVQPGTWRNWLDPARSEIGSTRFWFTAVVLFSVAPLGAAIFLWPIMSLIQLARRRVSAIDLLPPIALTIYLACVFVPGPTIHGGLVDELWHRPFVWLNFLFLVWCSVRLISFLPRRVQQSDATVKVAILACTVLLAYPLMTGQSVQVPDVDGYSYANVALPNGLINCASFIRANADPYDVVQTDEQSEFPLLSSFTEHRAYMGRAARFWKQCFDNTPVYKAGLQRREVLSEFEHAQSEQSLSELVKKTGIRWFVAQPTDNIAWANEQLIHPIYQSDGFQVYDLSMVRK